MKTTGSKLRNLLAVAGLAYLMALSAIASGFAAGLSAEGAMRDAFGNPLCITSGQHGSETGGAGHGDPAKCCATACQTLQNFSIDGAGDPSAAPIRRETALAAPVWRVRPSAPPSATAPGNPRAPPFLT